MSESRPAKMGDHIRHPDWGPGRVIGLIRGGRVLRVEFEDMPGTPWEVPREEITFEPSKAPGAKTPKAQADRASSKKAPKNQEPRETRGHEPTRTEKPEDGEGQSNAESPLDDEVLTARQALEALRLGVVPHSHLGVYTVGRDVELYVVLKDLEEVDRSGGLRVVLGDYGAGKTHFLEMTELLALEMGFLATRATLDSQEVLPNKPRRVFHQLARGIRYPDDPSLERRGLRPLLERAAQDGALIRRWSSPKHSDYHPYLGPTLFYMAVLPKARNSEELQERLVDWAEGSEVSSNEELEEKLRRATAGRTRLYALKDFRTVTHLYTLLLGGVAELARQVGYKGLAIMVDEAEFYSVLRGQDRTFSQILFRTFAAACLPLSKLLFDPAVLPRGGQAIHRSFSYRYRENQPLYCIFALTHDPDGKSLLQNSLSSDRFMELTPFQTSDYIALASRVLSLYRLAEPAFSPGQDIETLMGKVLKSCHIRGLIENPRQALKFITEVVDITRHAPERLRPVLKDLATRLEAAAL